jgi:hypothetical protein
LWQDANLSSTFSNAEALGTGSFEQVPFNLLLLEARSRAQWRY